jgi:predicted PilT family ATPase
VVRDNYTYEKTYDELKSISTLNKDKLISIIVSDKSFTKGHRSRVKFVKKLKKELGEDIDIFGKGYNEIVDKWEAIAPYKYTIVIENSSYNNYWTEKLADAFLGQSYPVYYGCKNIYDYFPEDSLSLIDIRKSDKAIKKIREIIDNNLYEKSLDNIKKSKDLILDKYQLFPMIYKYTQKYKF